MLHRQYEYVGQAALLTSPSRPSLSQGDVFDHQSDVAGRRSFVDLEFHNS